MRVALPFEEVLVFFTAFPLEGEGDGRGGEGRGGEGREERKRDIMNY